jgi:LCP family protein required for cell wall assembly
MAEDEPESEPAARGTHRGRRGRKHRRGLKIAAWTAAGCVLVAAGGAAYLYTRLNGNLRGVNINAALGTDRPTNTPDGSMDLLVLGSDSRSGANKAAGGGHDDGTARSDTAMIVHVYKGRRRAAVVSVPRDTLVDRPGCVRVPGGGWRGGEHAPPATNSMFNEAYTVGGPACAVKTVEAMTGIRMDHYIEVDFAGFEHLVDALGGVAVTTTRPLDDADSHLDLPAGRHTLNGAQALGLVRTRHAIGDGSDLGRIKLQQAFMKALLARIDGLGLLSSPAQLFRVADTATSSLTTDSDLASVGDLVSLAHGLSGLHPAGITMITMPVVYDPDDPNRVLPLTPRDEEVWSALRADRPIPATATKGSAGDQVHTGGVVRTGKGS